MCSVYERHFSRTDRECRAVESEKTFAIPSVNASRINEMSPVRLIIGHPARPNEVPPDGFDATTSELRPRSRAMTLAFRDPICEEYSRSFFQRFDDGRGSRLDHRGLDDDRGLIRDATIIAACPANNEVELLAGPDN